MDQAPTYPRAAQVLDRERHSRPHSSLSWGQVSDDDLVYLTVSALGIGRRAPGRRKQGHGQRHRRTDAARPSSIIDAGAIVSEAVVSPLRSLKISPTWRVSMNKESP